MNLSPEAQAELEREMRRRIRVRELRRKMAPFGIVLFIAIGIILGIIGFSFNGPLIGVGGHPLALPFVIIAIGSFFCALLVFILIISGFYD